MNPRIQVEHTVTEETTDIDLVRAQLQIAGGATLESLGVRQQEIRQRGFALQCRVTTEDPANGFRPDCRAHHGVPLPGRRRRAARRGLGLRRRRGLPLLRSSAGEDLRARADLQSAVSRARRAVAELRVRGVKTNQGFLLALLNDPDVLAGHTHTTFVDERPDLSAAGPGGDRASRLLKRLAEVTVNHEPANSALRGDPRAKLPAPPGARRPPGRASDCSNSARSRSPRRCASNRRSR